MAETSDDALTGNDSTAADSNAGDALGLALDDRPVNTEVNQQREQLRALFRQAPLGISAVVVLTAVLTTAFWNTVPDYLLLPWLAFLGLNSALHSFILHEYTRNEKRIAAITSWTRYQTTLAGASGLAWGIGFALMLPYLSGGQQTFYLMLLCLLCTAHLPVLAAVLNSYGSFLLVSTLPAILGLVFVADNIAVTWLGGLVLMVAGLMIAAWNYHTVLLRAFRLAEDAQQYTASLYETNEKNRVANLQLKKAVHDQEQNGLKLNAARLSSELTLNSIKEAVITTDLDGRIIYMNPLAEEYCGWSATTANGRSSTDIIRIIDEQNRVRIEDPVHRCLQNRSTVQGNDYSILVRQDGLEYGIEFETTPLRDGQGEIRGAVLAIRDVSQRRDQLRTLSWQATHDPLTGLINRREFELRMENLLEKHTIEEREHALCFIDLDNFKLINDTCGHIAGDTLLKKIAGQLRERIRDTDTLARVGGDEFGLILYSCDTERARLIGDGLRNTLRDMQFEWEGYSFNVSASIGIVPIDNTTTLLNDALRSADTACYQAKERGGDQLVIHAPNSHAPQDEQSESRWIESIMQSIHGRHFKLYSQTIEPLDSFNPVNINEILLRVCDPDGRLIMPRRFLSVAQRYHLLPQIDLAVLDSVLEFMHSHKAFLQDNERININLSLQTINDPRSLDRIAEMLKESGAIANRLCFELGERALVSEPDRSAELLNMLHRNGCRAAIDDFGFSLGAFRYLQSLNLDYIKIDARQMQDPQPRSLDYTLIESINQLSHRIGAQTIVKNISNQNVLDALHEIGVDYVQGYIIRRPELLSEVYAEDHQADVG
ncbi:diguanylate cyclase (GGDEF)-like protein/PAS domain S-box-containing protein [Methylohalomonas lacus]|uniref:Diguanylate cyclase (GGDEF)-like protein/PAS domain S-box-containing protein n=1 Tax=Methylohalomonas lacus TaxID=398773 RepID=A0AAE3L273_9GAMM|nr:EAL domain-containing protein [Methylohalomonas lacus]MCS3904600.1 diguanylate cyclase (GGDEF)-like protein/PAS domain S-box-containing protein [Methylohalomonas lacus]